MKQLILLLTLLVSVTSFSQIGIGTPSPNNSAALDITSTTKGLLPPRLTTAQRNTVSAPPAGLQIWCSDCENGLGAMQVYNGSAWISMTGSTSVPTVPTSVSATPGYLKAVVSFTGSSSTATMAGYTVTATPSGGGTPITAIGQNSPITVTGLINGTSYTFTVVATNAAGNSVASAPSNAVIPNCGAKISPTEYKVFACYNLGVLDTFLGDPNVPVQAIHGNYYQWGKIVPVADANTSAFAIVGWSTTAAGSGSWLDTNKTGNDPCPDGFRVPTKTQWDGVITNNTLTRTGSWADDAGNFTTAIHFGPNASTKTLTLPAAGFRRNYDGVLFTRANNGIYWSSTENGPNSSNLYFNISSAVTNNSIRTYGFSVRCVSE